MVGLKKLGYVGAKYGGNNMCVGSQMTGSHVSYLTMNYYNPRCIIDIIMCPVIDEVGL